VSMDEHVLAVGVQAEVKPLFRNSAKPSPKFDLHMKITLHSLIECNDTTITANLLLHAYTESQAWSPYPSACGSFKPSS